jgi:LmbE family N-acetylglucosaminyl deacetylase
VDITATLDRKLQALEAHTSQLGDWAAKAARIRERAEAVGALHSVRYAEEFKRLVLS